MVASSAVADRRGGLRHRDGEVPPDGGQYPTPPAGAGAAPARADGPPDRPANATAETPSPATSATTMARARTLFTSQPRQPTRNAKRPASRRSEATMDTGPRTDRGSTDAALGRPSRDSGPAPARGPRGRQ